MTDARDAEDSRLLAEGRIDELLAGYVDLIVARCVAKMRGPVGEDVAQAVCERLWKELKLGKHRDGRVPFRVIVHQVVKYTCAGWYEKGWGESELIEVDGPTPDPTAEIDHRLDLEAFIATIPPGDRSVAELAWLGGLEAAEIAVELGKQPNAIHQATSRNKQRLRAWLEEAA
jgi:DNA-directed RNA polymerase specialized sigma24 family protein